MGAKNSVLPPLDKTDLRLSAQQRFGLDAESYREVELAFQRMSENDPKQVISKLQWDRFFDQKCEGDKEDREMYEDVWRLMNCEKSKTMDFAKFLLFMCVGTADQKTKLTASFALADRKSSGKLTEKNLREVFERPILQQRRQETGNKKAQLTPDEKAHINTKVREFIDAVDKDRDGIITLDDFVNSYDENEELFEELYTFDGLIDACD
jgi:Ca2+-binding EF-hand superfamily protein